MAQVNTTSVLKKLFSKLLSHIPSILNKIIKKNKDKGESKSSVFDCTYKISISFDDYFIRLVELCEPESNTIIFSLILIDKICENKKVILSKENIHKVFFTALFIAFKMNEDEIFNEKHFSIASGLSNNEIALLEKEFVEKLDYKLNVSNNKYRIYLNAFC